MSLGLRMQSSCGNFLVIDNNNIINFWNRNKHTIVSLLLVLEGFLMENNVSLLSKCT